MGSVCIMAACTPQGGETIPATIEPPSLGQILIRAQDEMRMVFVPAGSFMMGSTEEDYRAGINQCRQYYDICQTQYSSREAPRHQVSLSAFWMDQTEVTTAQYQLCVEHGACAPLMDCDERHAVLAEGDRADHPVVCIDWAGAVAYCTWVGGRLPTEAEWEYAYRGPKNLLYPWGDEFDGTRLNYCDLNCPEDHADSEFDDGFSITAPVGSYPNNTTWVAALDMAGNVFEWVGDWFAPYESSPQTDPVGPDSGTQRVIRGWTWALPSSQDARGGP